MTEVVEGPTPTRIVFGTDGWRARVADDYTYENVRRCAHGVARYVTGRGDQAKGVVSRSLSFSTSLGKSSGFGAVRRYASSIGDPLNSSGVIDGNISSAMPCRRTYSATSAGRFCGSGRRTS